MSVRNRVLDAQRGLFYELLDDDISDCVYEHTTWRIILYTLGVRYSMINELDDWSEEIYGVC